MAVALKPAYLHQFQCTGPACPDNCCNRFTVLVDPATLDKYQTQAPELLSVVKEKQGIGNVLAFDEQTGCCPKMEQGACTIHANYGTEFLTDVCHLYPRITRQLGDQLVMAGTVSCPEIARLALFGEAACELSEGETDRVPFNIKDYLPSGETPAACLTLNETLVQLADQAPTAEVFLSKLAFFVMRFGDKPLSQWQEIISSGWKLMDVMVPAAQQNEQDPFYLLIAFTTLLSAGKIQPSQRLSEVLSMIELALNCRMDATQATLNIQPDSMQRAADLKSQWQQHHAEPMQHILKKLVMVKLQSSLYPFAGLGDNQQQRISWLIVHVATVKLGLMAAAHASGGTPEPDVTIKVIQTITRVLDHLNNLDFALPMYEEAGWLDTQRLIGLLH